MFAISSDFKSLSPHAMKFGNLWIYDLSTFHHFWKRVVQDKKNIFTDESIWGALLKAYKLHLFSPLETLLPLAKDFHSFYPDLKSKISDKKITEIFHIFSHLGLKKIEHLKRFSRAELQARFGFDWALFLDGILNQRSPWKWVTHRCPENIFWNYEFEDFCIDSNLLLEEVGRGLQKLSNENPYFLIQTLNVHFLLSQENESLTEKENSCSLFFTYEPSLQKDLSWILKLLQERLSTLKFDYPIWKVFLNLLPAKSKRHLQLSLFENRADAISWRELCQKLHDQNFKAFQPAPTVSYLPEESWKKVSADTPLSFSTHGLFRPLLQGAPIEIPLPEGALKFTERMTWFDADGTRHERDYFMAREKRAWIWVFRSEQNLWFKQGVFE